MAFKKYSEYIPLENESLVSMAQQGDELAFNTLAARFLNTRYTDSDAAYVDAEDFVQEVKKAGVILL